MKQLFRQFHKKLQKNPKFTPIDHRNMKKPSLIINLRGRVLKILGKLGWADFQNDSRFVHPIWAYARVYRTKPILLYCLNTAITCKKIIWTYYVLTYIEHHKVCSKRSQGCDSIYRVKYSQRIETNRHVQPCQCTNKNVHANL